MENTIIDEIRNGIAELRHRLEGLEKRLDEYQTREVETSAVAHNETLAGETVSPAAEPDNHQAETVGTTEEAEAASEVPKPENQELDIVVGQMQEEAIDLGIELPELASPNLARSLNDRLSERSLNDVQSERGVKSVSDSAAAVPAWKKDRPGTPVKNIISAISLNDRVLLIKTLFREDPLLFQQSISELNAMDSLKEGEDYISSHFPEWKMNSDIVYRFMMAVRRKLTK